MVLKVERDKGLTYGAAFSECKGTWTVLFTAKTIYQNPRQSTTRLAAIEGHSLPSASKASIGEKRGRGPVGLGEHNRERERN